MEVLTVFQFIYILIIVAWLTVNMVHIVRVAPVAGPLKHAPRVSVCVPARNEERGIEACLTSLLQQDYPHFEVIAVDDNSTDGTGAIIDRLAAQDARLIAVKSPPLPEGWYGKPHALHQAVQRASGDLLVFTDADPVFEPSALASAVFTMETRKVDLLTLMPASVFGSFWERVVQPVVFGFIAAKTRFKKVNSSEHKEAMGFGAFIMIRREVYARIGGHEALRQAILEDIGIARLAKKVGAACLVADAKPLFSIRMYHSLREIWVGWRKNIFLAFRSSILRTLQNVSGLLAFVVTPYAFVLYHAVEQSHWVWQAMSWAGLLLVWITGAGLCEELRLKRRTQFWFPLGALVTAAIMLNSMVFILSRGHSEWRGRTYAKPV